MPPQKTQIQCPRCRKPITAMVEQLFDVTSDPESKRRLLGGLSNVAVCQSCGFNGPLATPLVYHDADKELLLTFFPSELNIPINEQEKLIGPLITQVTNRLPLEKRKAYLLRPQNFLTFQSLIERILAADGITPEMIQAQQKKIDLIEKLLSSQDAEARSSIIKTEDAFLDDEFFTLFGHLLENALSSGDKTLIQKMGDLQKALLTDASYGRKIASRYNETQEAIKTLQSAGNNLDRAKLLEFMIAAPNDDRLTALVSMTRPGLDYQFFQTLTEKVNTSINSEKASLIILRDKLLDLTQQYDRRIEEEVKEATNLLRVILDSADIQQATLDHLPEINEIFIQVLNQAHEANQKNDTVLMPKIKTVIETLQKASSPPAEYELIEKFINTKDDGELDKLIEDNADRISPEIIDAIGNIITQSEQDGTEKTTSDEQKTIMKLQNIYRRILKFSMKKNM